MTAERARAPLGHRRAALAGLARVAGGSVHAAEVPFPVQVDLRADPDRAGGLRLPLPREPNTFTTAPPWDALWLGPDEWLLVAPAGTDDGIVAELERDLGEAHRSVVDVSANRAVVDLSGPGVRDLLARGCALDLHPRSWRPGMCAQTLLARAQVILQQREEATRVFVRPSFGDYLVDWLVDAAGAGPWGGLTP